MQDIHEGKHKCQRRKRAQAHNAAIGDKTSQKRSATRRLDNRTKRHDGPAHEHNAPGHGVLELLPRQELHARKKHHGKTDQCNDRSVQHRNPVAGNPKNEQAEHDNNSLDFIGLNLLSCGSLFADTLKALVGNGFGFQNLSDKEPGDGNHHDNHRQRDDDPIEERDRRARSLLENIHCNNVERATCRRCHATRDGRNRDTNHQAASKIRF